MNSCVLQMNARTRWGVWSGFYFNVGLIQSTSPGEQSHLFQKRRRFSESFSVGVIQLVDLDAVEVTQSAMQSISRRVSWVHYARLADSRR